MIARYVQKGEAIDYRPVADVAAGSVVFLGTLAGVARLDIEAGKLGAIWVSGVYETPKDAAAIPLGAPVFYDRENNILTATMSGNTYLGKAVEGAAATDSTVRFLLNAQCVSLNVQ